MAAAALLVSILALAFAGASVIYTRRVAQAETAQAAAAERADHDRREPLLRIEPRDRKGHAAFIDIHNDGPQDLTKVELELRPPTQLIDRFDGQGGLAETAALEGIRKGHQAPVGVHLTSDELSGTTRVYVTATAGDEVWTLYRDVRIGGRRTILF